MKKLNIITAVLLVAISYRCSGADDSNGNSVPSGTSDPNDRITCDKIIDRYAQCNPSMTEADIDNQKKRCDSPPSPQGQEIRNSWRVEFQTAFDMCYFSLFDLQSDEVWIPDSPECTTLNDIDDVCFPEALLEVRGDALDERTMRTCIENSEQCERIVTSALTVGSAVGACLTKWATCSDGRSDGDRYWTEDYCLFIVALTDNNREDANRCLDLPCGQVADCLYETGALNF